MTALMMEEEEERLIIIEIFDIRTIFFDFFLIPFFCDMLIVIQNDFRRTRVIRIGMFFQGPLGCWYQYTGIERLSLRKLPLTVQQFKL